MVNTASFMMAHLEKVARATKGDIVVGGITNTLVEVLGYDREFRRLEVTVNNIGLDIFVCLSQILNTKFIPNTYMLTIRNTPQQNLVL